MKYPRYPEYRASGVEWLGEVPAHWQVKRLRFLASTNPMGSRLDGVAEDDLVSFVPMGAVGEYGGLRLDMERELAEIGSGYTYFADGDVVLAKITPCFENGKGALAAGLTNGIAFGTTELHVVRADPVLDRSYLFYLTIAHPFRRLGEAEMFGAGGQKRVPESFIKDFRTPLPPWDEQRTIAAFMDRETARIDALIATKRRFIGLLREKRAALISRTAARGLDPDAPLQDSGLDWLGDVPAHWQVKRLRFLASTNPLGSSLSGIAGDDMVSFVPMDAVGEYGGLRLDVERELAEIGSGYTYFADGDVVLAKITPCFENGKGALASGLTNGVAFGTTELHVLRPGPALDRRYLFYSTIGHPFRKLGESEMFGAGGQKRVPEEFIKDFRMPLPSLDEQRAIAAFLDRETTRIDRLIAKNEIIIGRLTEHRSSLITYAVVGKIDTRIAA